MNPTTSFLLDIIIHGGMLAAFATAAAYFFLMIRYENKPKRLFLITGTLMTLISLQALEYLTLILSDIHSRILHDVGLSVMVNLLVMPLCYLMLMELTLYRKVTLRLALLHLGIPLILVVIYSASLYSPLSTLISHLKGEMEGAVLITYIIWMVIAIICFAIPPINNIKRYNENIRDYYADIEGRDINWVGRVLGLFLIIGLLFLVLKVILDNDISRFLYSVAAMWFWLSIAWNVSRMRHHDVHITKEETDTPPVENHLDKEESAKFLYEFHDMLLKDRLYASSDLTRDVMAKAMGTNYRFLIQNLKEATGMTFSAYVTDVRMEEACRMLRETNKTASEILYACGFESVSTFYRIFSRKYGCSPVEYRKRYKD